MRLDSIFRLMVKHRVHKLKTKEYDIEMNSEVFALQERFIPGHSNGTLPFICEKCGYQTHTSPQQNPLHMLVNGKVCGRIVQNLVTEEPPTSDEGARMPSDEQMLMWSSNADPSLEPEKKSANQ